MFRSVDPLDGTRIRIIVNGCAHCVKVIHICCTHSDSLEFEHSLFFNLRSVETQRAGSTVFIDIYFARCSTLLFIECYQQIFVHGSAQVCASNCAIRDY